MTNAWNAWRLRKSETEAVREASPRDEAILRSWNLAGVPGRFNDVGPAEGPVGWTYISGTVGTGKTHTACRMLRRAIEDGAEEVIPGLWRAPRARFTTAGAYLEAVKASFKSPDDRAHMCRTVELLVLDDLGQEVPTAWAAEQIFELVNHRYNEDLTTIVTSQFSLGNIAGRLAGNGGREQAEAIGSRLAGMCRGILLTGGDRRVA